MAQPTLDGDSKALVNRYLSRRGLLGGAAAGALLGFGFSKTRAIQAQQADGNSLYDQLGGVVGISLVMVDFVNNVAGDDRISMFFADTVKNNRVVRLRELLVQQVAAAAGGPVTYTGLDMRTAHTGRGITSAAFTALVEDLVAALKQNNVPEATQMTLLNALAPLAGDIVEAP